MNHHRLEPTKEEEGEDDRGEGDFSLFGDSNPAGHGPAHKEQFMSNGFTSVAARGTMNGTSNGRATTVGGIPTNRPSRESVLQRLSEALLRRSLTKVGGNEKGFEL